MKKRHINKKLVLVIVVLVLLTLAGCQSNTNSDGTIKVEKIIYLTTSWGSIWESDGLFTFIFVYPLAQCINFFAQYMDIILAITITTVLVNVLLLSASIKSTVASQKMQMMQPELAKIQEKYKDRSDETAKMAQATEMQNLYKKNNINPLSSMLVPFLQLPILISMYYAVQRANAVVTGTVFGMELTTTPWAAFKLGGSGYILFAIYILMGVAQFGSSKITQWLSKKKEKENHSIKQYDKPASTQGSMNMMMYGMLVLIMVMAINWPTAMSLYWLISSVVNILKTIFIQKRYIDNAKA